jgi:hypothetical protein
MDVLDKENGTAVLGSCEEVCCNCESSGRISTTRSQSLEKRHAMLGSR